MSLKKILLAAATAAFVSVLGAGSSTAQPYPFCRNGEGGYGDCRYDTLAQCQSAIAGTSGSCQPNFALPTPEPSRLPRQRARRS